MVAEEGEQARMWGFGNGYQTGSCVVVLSLLVIRLGLSYYRNRPATDDPKVMAVVRQAFGKEAGFVLPQDYQLERVRVGQAASVVRPDGQQFPARTVSVGALAHRLYADFLAGSPEDPGQEQAVREIVDDLKDTYGWDLSKDDQLAALPPRWRLVGAR